ncbi:HAD family phosphatase [Candidatus Woesearchaeota archaeon]|nr:HAD family phosphatase [Candidatus Woesearchaeota archaeon]
MIKAIIFDLGNTYCLGSSHHFLDKAYKILGINADLWSQEIIFDSNYNSGKISIQECFKNMFKTDITDSQMMQLISEWKNTWKPTDEMLCLVKELKKNYKLAILSNSDPVNSEKYHKMGWYAHFDVLALSHEIGILKPDKRIYEITLEKLGHPAGECLFIDDQDRCLEPALEMGMKTILFEDIKQLKDDLKKNGIMF